jgi:hypothetical protein
MNMSSSAKFCLAFVPGVLAAAAFLTTLFGGIYCRFLSFTSNEEVNGEPVTLHFGIWYYLGWVLATDSNGDTVAMQTCYRYPEGTVFDAKWKSSKAFSTMAIIIGGCVTIWALCAGCLYPTKKMYQLASMLYMICCLFTGLSLLILDSDACNSNILVELLEATSTLGLTFPDTCTSAYGAKCTFSATVLWFAAAIGLLMVAPPERNTRVTTETRGEEVKEDVKASAEEDLAAAAEENVEPTPIMEGQQQEA